VVVPDRPEEVRNEGDDSAVSDTDGEPEVSFQPAESNPAPEVSPAPVAKPEHAHDDLRPIVERLDATVSELKETVTGLVSVGQEQLHDTAPTKKPWTHWGNQ
jgi:hypothetical protein